MQLAQAFMTMHTIVFNIFHLPESKHIPTSSKHFGHFTLCASMPWTTAIHCIPSEPIIILQYLSLPLLRVKTCIQKSLLSSFVPFHFHDHWRIIPWFGQMWHHKYKIDIDRLRMVKTCIRFVKFVDTRIPLLIVQGELLGGHESGQSQSSYHRAAALDPALA